MLEHKYLEVKELTKKRRELVAKIFNMLNDDWQNITFFHHDKKHAVDEFEKNQERYNELLLELKCTHNNPIESNAKPFPIDMFESMGLKSPISELTDLTITGEELPPTLERYLN